MYQEFDHLLEEQSPIESYIEWLDTMVDRCVVKVGRQESKVQPITRLRDMWVVQSPVASHLEAPQQPQGPRSPSSASARPAPVMHIGPW